MITLDFCDYLNICNRLFSFCDYVRRRAPYADSVLLKDSQKWENELLPGYNNPQKLQLSCREYLKGKNVDEVAEYRQGILIEGTITALVDDLRSGAVSCPDNIKGWLILSLKGLVTICSYLSQMCFAEFDKIDCTNEDKQVKKPFLTITPESLERFKDYFKPSFRGIGNSNDTFSEYIPKELERIERNGDKKKSIQNLALAIYNDANCLARSKKPSSYSGWCKVISDIFEIDGGLPYKPSQLKPDYNLYYWLSLPLEKNHQKIT